VFQKNPVLQRKGRAGRRENKNLKIGLLNDGRRGLRKGAGPCGRQEEDSGRKPKVSQSRQRMGEGQRRKEIRENGWAGGTKGLFLAYLRTVPGNNPKRRKPAKGEWLV